MYIAVVTASFFIFGGEGGNVGLAITQGNFNSKDNFRLFFISNLNIKKKKKALAMTGMVQWGMRQVSENLTKIFYTLPQTNLNFLFNRVRN